MVPEEGVEPRPGIDNT